MFDETGALSRDFLLKRGQCCHNGCKNCPYGEIICSCFNINKEKIVELKNNGYTIEQIQKETRATLGCGSCRFDIEEILEEK